MLIVFIASVFALPSVSSETMPYMWSICNSSTEAEELCNEKAMLAFSGCEYDSVGYPTKPYKLTNTSLVFSESFCVDTLGMDTSVRKYVSGKFAGTFSATETGSYTFKATFFHVVKGGLYFNLNDSPGVIDFDVSDSDTKGSLSCSLYTGTDCKTAMSTTSNCMTCSRTVYFTKDNSYTIYAGVASFVSLPYTYNLTIDLVYKPPSGSTWSYITSGASSSSSSSSSSSGSADDGVSSSISSSSKASKNVIVIAGSAVGVGIVVIVVVAVIVVKKYGLRNNTSTKEDKGKLSRRSSGSDPSKGGKGKLSKLSSKPPSEKEDKGKLSRRSSGSNSSRGGKGKHSRRSSDSHSSRGSKGKHSRRSSGSRSSRGSKGKHSRRSSGSHSSRGGKGKHSKKSTSSRPGSRNTKRSSIKMSSTEGRRSRSMGSGHQIRRVATIPLRGPAMPVATIPPRGPPMPPAAILLRGQPMSPASIPLRGPPMPLARRGQLKWTT